MRQIETFSQNSRKQRDEIPKGETLDALHIIKLGEGVNDVRFGMSVKELNALGYTENRKLHDRFSKSRAFTIDVHSTCYVQGGGVISAELTEAIKQLNADRPVVFGPLHAYDMPELNETPTRH